MTGFTYEYTNGYINNQTEIRLIKVYNDGVYYFKDWVTEELVKEYEDELGRRISKSI